MTRRLIGVATIAIAGMAVASACPLSHMNVVEHDVAAALGSEYATPLAYLPNEDMERDGKDVTVERVCGLVSKSITGAANRAAQLAMGSEDGVSAILLLRCVAARLGPVSLTNLDFVFVGDAGQEQEARTLVERWGAKFYFVRDRGNVDPAQFFPDLHCPEDTE